MLYTIRKYEPQDFEIWNAFVSKAKNATFLFHRNFMEYHRDRFADFSLIIFHDGQIKALLPAHVVGNELFSHNGLTYGGLVYTEKMRQADMIKLFQALLQFLGGSNIHLLHIKTIPSIYHLKPAEELQYALFAAGAKLTRRDSLSVIDLTKSFDITKTRKESIRRGTRHDLEIREEPGFKLFWENILIPNLKRKHNASPVHSLEEIESLHKHFPENIRHFNVYHQGRIVAGTTVFVSENVAHPQYISGQEEKNELGSLDFLYHHLITEVFKRKRFFDFGISNEEQGRKLNGGLIFWKETFGASTIVHDFYTVETANYKLLDSVLI